MITRETVIMLDGYKFRFTVIDNGAKWIVTLENEKKGFKIVSSDCRFNWNNGLSYVLKDVARFISVTERIELISAVLTDWRFDHTGLRL